MKILLIQPKMNKRPMDTDLKTRLSPSLALLTLISLTPDAHEVSVVNENVERIDFDCGPDLVGITITLDVMPRACRIAAAFMSRGIPVVAGGIHITCCPEECREHFSAICIGPAERVWARIVRDAEAGCLNQEYSDMEGFRGDEIASPHYGFGGQKHYLYSNVVLTGRGCPNRCSFCYNSCANRLYVRRPIPHVISDIKNLGTRHILFIDDNFIGDPGYTRELLNGISGMGLVWSAAVTTKILEYPGLLDLMARTGCMSLFIGFESINTISLESVNKDNKVRQYEGLVEAIHSRGIMINASMVFGLDGDGKGTFERTLDWLEKMRIETLTSHILTPYPGTELHRWMDAAGRIIDRDLGKYNTSNVVFRPLGMTEGELLAGYRQMYKRFYSFRSIIRRFPESRAQRRAYLLFNLFYRKFGRLTSAVTRIVPMGVLGKLAASISFGRSRRVMCPGGAGEARSEDHEQGRSRRVMCPGGAGEIRCEDHEQGLKAHDCFQGREAIV
ncbi:MAG: B12-binding domain-containing radical SAM protein [Clostridiales bacterium]|nr:B12-binding domain-containing radical SAM protein [Clostridiales bacterium]